MIRVQDATPYSLVVGVDGSEASIDALCWAADEARLLNTQVIAVHAWQPTEALRAPYTSMSDVPTPRRTATTRPRSSRTRYPSCLIPTPELQ
ncbi:universal stress protein [Streptomyces xanthochromogenes]|uniref:universal stress protein n=1 Tax=Streptomyces xanthochromogenes TaxID=67384 RepID=UPI0038279BDF